MAAGAAGAFLSGAGGEGPPLVARLLAAAGALVEVALRLFAARG
jgi:hypothetical protein